MKNFFSTFWLALLIIVCPTLTQAQAPDLGTAANFVLFTSDGAVTNTGTTHATGNVGTNNGSSTGFGNVNGTMNDGNGVSASAKDDLLVAYDDLDAAIPDYYIASPMGGGDTLTAGVYSLAAATELDGNLILDAEGDADAVFIFLIEGAFSTTANTNVKLANGALACNVFWKVEGMVSLATKTLMKGTIIANNSAIDLASGVNIEGRALSTTGAVTVDKVLVFTPIGCGSPTLTGPAPPDLKSVGAFSLFTSNGELTNSGVSNISGSVGTNVGLTTGFATSNVSCEVHDIPDGATAQAATDLLEVYDYLSDLTYDIELLYPAQFGNSLVLTPHIYLLNAATTFTDTLFLNAQGNADAVFVMKIYGALSTSTFATVVMKNGAKAKNVYWLVEGAVDLNADTKFSGTIVANNGAIKIGKRVILDGRAYSTTGAVTTEAFTIVNDISGATINGAATATTFHLCERDSVTLSASAADTYNWSTGAKTRSIVVKTAGEYTVTTESDTECHGTSPKFTVIIDSLKVATITPKKDSSICAGRNVVLVASAGAKYKWSTNDTTQSITVAATGNYSVVVSNSAGCSSRSDTVKIIVNPLPVVTVSTSGPTTFCQGDSVVLTSTAAASYLWSTGKTTRAITVQASGTFNVTVVDTNGCSKTSSNTVVTVNASVAPVITTNGPTSFCQGSSVILTTAPAASYLWSNGATTQSIIVGTSGDYTVRTTLVNGCVKTSAVTTVIVNPTPPAIVTLSGPTTFCQGSTVTLTASAATSYLWSNGSTTQSVIIGASGSYFVTVFDSKGCVATSVTTSVTVNPLPIPLITANGPTTFCEGSSVMLTSAVAVSYLWSNGATSQSINVASSGNFTVRTTNSFGCFVISPATIVKVHPKPLALIVNLGPTNVCIGSSVVLTVNAAASYLWSTGATTRSITLNSGRIVSVSIVDTNGCTATSTNWLVVINPLPVPVITASGPTTFCQGSPLILTASEARSYLWSNGATTRSINVSGNAGIYSVTVIDTNGCTATSAATNVTINPAPLPTILAVGPTTFCQGASLVLSASSGSNYKWSTGETTSSITVKSSGSYSVTVTNQFGCSAVSAPTSVTVTPAPSAQITAAGATRVCAGETVTLTASPNRSYLWSNGQVSQTIVVSTSGVYTVSVTNDAGCITQSTPVFVTVFNPVATPTIQESGPLTFCAPGNVTLTSSFANGYSWSNGAVTRSITVSASGTYFVTTSDVNGCIGVSTPRTVVSTVANTVSVTAGGPTSICEGETVRLTASGSGSYVWSTNETTRSIDVSSSGLYWVTMTTGVGCSSISPATTVSVKAAQNGLVIGRIDDVLRSPYSNVNTWYKVGQASSVGTGESITCSGSAEYYVVGTGANGCEARSSNLLVACEPTSVAGQDLGSFGVSVYPNPSQGNFSVKYNVPNTMPVAIRLFSVYGVQVATVLPNTVQFGAQEVAIEASRLESGVYFLETQIGNTVFNTKVVISK